MEAQARRVGSQLPMNLTEISEPMTRRTSAVLERDGVSVVPVHTSFTAFSGSVVDAAQTLAR